MTKGEIIEQLESIVGTYEILVGNGVNSDILEIDDIEAIREAIKALNAEPCGGAISRQAAIDLAEELKDDLPDDDRLSDMVMSHNEGIWEYQTKLSLLPPVTPAGKVGKWIAQDIHNCHTDFRCSACGYIHSFMHLYGEPAADYTYCPMCGVKMASPTGAEGSDKE